MWRFLTANYLAGSTESARSLRDTLRKVNSRVSSKNSGSECKHCLLTREKHSGCCSTIVPVVLAYIRTLPLLRRIIIDNGNSNRKKFKLFCYTCLIWQIAARMFGEFGNWLCDSQWQFVCSISRSDRLQFVTMKPFFDVQSNIGTLKNSSWNLKPG